MQQEEKNVLSLLLPEGILEWFEVTKIEEKINDKAKDDLERHLYPKVLHVYLDEILSEAAEERGLRPNEYGIFFREVLDRLPVTASSVARYHGMEGSTVERHHKHFLSGFPDWVESAHAAEWVVMPENIGERLSIDETKLGDDVYTILSNKAGHGKRGTLIAVAKGTRSDPVASVINKISEADRMRVKEITMDFSGSMQRIAETCFPRAKVVIDCFHVIQSLIEGLEEVRLKEKRAAVSENKRKEVAFRQDEERRAKQRKYYRGLLFFIKN